MVEQAGALPGEAETSLSDSRAQFVASLGRRLEALREALTALQQAPRSAPHRDHLRRRIHAFGAAAGVLGFDRVFEAFREAEAVLGRSGPPSLGAAEIALIARTLDLVPSLVLGAAAPAARPRTAAADRRPGTYPTSVLVFGAAPLAESLNAAAASTALHLEVERTEDAERAEEFVRVTAPDVAVIDADRQGARELMETLTYDPLLDPVRIIAIGTFDRPEAAASLVALGVARVLPKPVSPESLKRSVFEVSRERTSPVQRFEPIGEATMETLAERLIQEVRRGLVDAVRPEGRDQAVSLGEGTDVLAAMWSSVARIRELVTMRSGGAVRFDATGPEGAVPLAPWMGDDRSRAGKASERRSSDGVSLKGRVIVVVDDDPSVVWFLSGLLRATGAEVLEAHDGTRALALVRERWPDLVVSDILMPGLDGFSLCREIKRDVALADVPVILLSWKEDLLQRARELGADADGYLRKEATASVVVQRAREVLLPRARVEARVTAGGEVRGRLDGLTPRLILEIACRHGRNASVTIRDAAFLYEVAVRDGQVRSASRTAEDGHADTGDMALSALLGVRAGRFAVRPDDTELTSTWSRDLRELVKGPVERARAAQGLLSKIERVARIDLDVAALEPYLAVSPLSARTIVQRLSEGEPPASILASGIASHVFESVLVDAILHGGVTRVVGSLGEDLTGARSSPGMPAVQPAVKVTQAAPVAMPRVNTPAPVVARQSTPIPPAPRVPTPIPAAPRVPTPIPAAARVPTPVPAAAAPPSPVHSGAEKSESASAASVSAGPQERSVAEEFASFFLDSVVPPAPSTDREFPRPLPMKAPAPPTSAPAEPSPLETALLALPAPAARARSGEYKAIEPSPVVIPPRPEAPRAEAKAEPKPEAPPLEDKKVSSEVAASDAEATRDAKKESLLPPTHKEGSRASGRPEGAASASAAETPVDMGAAVLFALGEEEPLALSRPKSDAAPSTRPDRPGVIPHREPSIVVNPADVSRSQADPVPEPQSARRTEPPKSAKGGAPKSGAPKSGAPKSGATAAAAQQVAPAKPAPTGNTGTFGFMVVLCFAAVAFYFGTTAVMRGREHQAPPSPNETAAAPPAVNVVPAPLTLSGPSDLDLPAGMTLEAGKGLLEVEVPQAASVLVDGVFVGQGPLKQLPLRPGPHEVRVRGDGLDLARTADVQVGRRVRLAATSAP